MRKRGVRRAVAAWVTAGSLMVASAACGGWDGGRTRADGTGAEPTNGAARTSPAARGTSRVPGVGDRLHGRIPAGSRQVVAVYGEGKDSADSTVVLYLRRGSTWRPVRSWAAHNGTKGWTTHHREGDKRSPVGVFTLSDAGGVLPDPGSRLPYTRSAAFAAPRWWAKAYWHDFDYVIAIDYNRVKGTPPNDPVRPEGAAAGGGIWLHLDHGSGTSACVSLPKAAMEYLLRTLDPKLHPVVVMGDRADLRA
ncbi:lipoprotein [Streptomyces cyaneogriseus subsp. noncyanogenus]|uniref:Lipoprotein n=1 Tax=Streptomyces cyaneogriseus subsp. noncyanogenus TaxID=477245 RepID=A0A0C5FT49_9ACTN|nr:L,D-transpeptidase family protein [Streptomyces cyaneogriseus]AJP00848.1 lipoprotein [Streptomyces cyaneogriseus subsp. noncyanogenus]